RLLLVVQADAQNTDEVATFANALTADGWNVLHIVAANPTADADAAATMILDSLKRVTSEMKAAPTTSLEIVAIADGAAALPACMTVLQSHRHATLPAIGGIAMIDAFEQPATESPAP